MSTVSFAPRNVPTKLSYTIFSSSCTRVDQPGRRDPGHRSLNTLRRTMSAGIRENLRISGSTFTQSHNGIYLGSPARWHVTGREGDHKKNEGTGRNTLTSRA